MTSSMFSSIARWGASRALEGNR